MDGRTRYLREKRAAVSKNYVRPRISRCVPISESPRQVVIDGEPGADLGQLSSSGAGYGDSECRVGRRSN